MKKKKKKKKRGLGQVLLLDALKQFSFPENLALLCVAHLKEKNLINKYLCHRLATFEHFQIIRTR